MTCQTCARPLFRPVPDLCEPAFPYRGSTSTAGTHDVPACAWCSLLEGEPMSRRATSSIPGWVAPDFFGLHPVPDSSHPSSRRLSPSPPRRLRWLLRGSEVVALTESTAAIRHRGGNITAYRRFNKPPLGPLGDSLDDCK
jgi:hypothetical protein